MTPVVLPTLTDAEMRRLPPASEEAGFGALTTERGPLPLKALDVQARIAGLLAETTVRQTFVNTHTEPLEATYIFPLPDRAAVTSFRLEVAGRIVEGQLKERAAARREYDQAIKAGHRAAITEEERPGVFTMRVGNLPPGESAIVRITLAGPLPFSDGEATFRFPLVVAPRYIPGKALPGPSVGDGVMADTDAVPDASRISPPVLLPGYPNPVQLSLSVDVAFSDLKPSDFRSSLHVIQQDETARGGWRFVLHAGERLNRDFILRFRLGGGKIATSLAVQPDATGDEGTFALTLVPPTANGSVPPRDVVYVLDRSGSMEGWKMVAARRAVSRMIESLTDRDRFTVLAFDDRIETPPGFDGTTLTPATDRHRFQAGEFLAKVESRGGTEMAHPLQVAVTELGRGDAKRERVVVLITDGQIGNEDQILRELGKRAKGVRMFTLGIDQAVNAAFLKRLADLGGGTCDLVESEDRLDEVMDAVNRRIGAPLLTGLRLEGDRMERLPGSVMPTRLPDLFAGSPIVIAGRYCGSSDGSIMVRGTDANNRPWSVEAWARPAGNAALSAVWARSALRELEDRYVIGDADRPPLEKHIVALSLRFGVLCRFTAFVAVDRAEVVNAGGEQHRVTQAVELPAGWAAGAVDAMQTTFCLSASAPTPAQLRQAFGRGAFGLTAGAPPQDTESVDSCLMEFEPQVEAVEEEQAESPDPGRKELFLECGDEATNGGLGEAAKVVHPVTLRDRARRLLDEMRLALEDVTVRLNVLRLRWDELEMLLIELVGACDPHPAVAKLREALGNAASLRQGHPGDDEIHAAWTAIEAALCEYLGEPAPRTAFWK
jgi:Ca-activated chloride channel family protein